MKGKQAGKKKIYLSRYMLDDRKLLGETGSRKFMSENLFSFIPIIR
jgi:capsular polysaccharide biosynthesis protein